MFSATKATGKVLLLSALVLILAACSIIVQRVANPFYFPKFLIFQFVDASKGSIWCRQWAHTRSIKWWGAQSTVGLDDRISVRRILKNAARGPGRTVTKTDIGGWYPYEETSQIVYWILWLLNELEQHLPFHAAEVPCQFCQLLPFLLSIDVIFMRSSVIVNRHVFLGWIHSVWVFWLLKWRQDVSKFVRSILWCEVSQKKNRCVLFFTSSTEKWNNRVSPSRSCLESFRGIARTN